MEEERTIYGEKDMHAHDNRNIRAKDGYCWYVQMVHDVY